MPDTWIQEAINYWKICNIGLTDGADLNSITSLEKQINIKLPEDFIEFYQVVNGFKDLDMNNNMFSIWPIEKIKEEYTAGGNNKFIGFSDYLIFSHTVGFLKNSYGVFNDFDFEKPVLNTFKEFINFINSPLADTSIPK